MDPNAFAALFLLFLLAVGAGLLLPKPKPPRKPDYTAHFFDERKP